MELINLTGTGDNDSRFDEFLHRIRNDLGFDEATFGIVSPSTGMILGFSTYSREWQDHYAREGYHMKDPAILRAIQSVMPVDWSRLTECFGYDEVFTAGRDYGIPERGVSIPVRGQLGERGILTVAYNGSEKAWETLKARHMRELQRRAVHLLDMIQSKKTMSELLMRRSLSKREMQILEFSANARSQAEIAARLAISERTVEVYMSSIKTKLRALNTPQAVGRAMMLQLVDV